MPVNPTQVKLAGSHHVLANPWPPSNLPMSSLPQWEASFSSQAFSANPQSLLPASPPKDLQPVTQQGWSCSRCWRDGGDRAGDAGLGVASRLETCKETKMLPAPTPCSLSTRSNFSRRELNQVYHISLQYLNRGFTCPKREGDGSEAAWRGKAGSPTGLGTLRRNQDPRVPPRAGQGSVSLFVCVCVTEDGLE